MPAWYRALSFTAVWSDCTGFNTDSLKLCLRKEKTKREKRRGRKVAKRMQRRVSLLSGRALGTFPDGLWREGASQGQGLGRNMPNLDRPGVADYVLVGSNLSSSAWFLLWP